MNKSIAISLHIAMSSVLLLPATGCQRVSSDVPSPTTVSVTPSTPSVPPESTIVLETNTPDLTIKSWWKLLDEAEVDGYARCRERAKSPPRYQSLISQVAQGGVLEHHVDLVEDCIKEEFSREITEVKNESETRAVIFATIRNTTPIPARAEPSEHSIKWRKEGSRYKYLVEKTGQGWRVTQAYRYDDFYEKYGGGKSPWKPEYESPKTPIYPSLAHRQ